jgi:ArsR family transcriptional regulator
MNKTVKILKALADTTRFEIVKDFLSGHESICPEVKMKLSKSQPTLSHHINKLLNADILTETKRGTNCYYKVNEKYLKTLGINLRKMGEVKYG